MGRSGVFVKERGRLTVPPLFTRAIVPRRTISSSSFAQRMADGQEAAEFVQALRGYLECPALPFVD
jgi:2-oxoisovalerate dehydrogenase E2 component (dihydrolipoyl transacylase)